MRRETKIKHIAELHIVLSSVYEVVSLNLTEWSIKFILVCVIVFKHVEIFIHENPGKNNTK